MKILFRIFTTLTATIGIFTYIYRAVFVNHRSVGSELAEDVIRVATFTREDDTEEFLDNKLLENRREYELPRAIFQTDIKEYMLGDMKVFTVNADEKRGKLRVLYLHGGGYINQPSPFHWRFISKLVEETELEFIVPIYPKAPEYTYIEAYEETLKLYKEMLKDGENIVIAGDSAGGGLTIGFVQYLKALGLPLPLAQVVICPWMDISLENPEIKDYMEIEPMLKVDRLKKVGHIWAGDDGLKNYKVSPLFGEVNDLPKIYIFSGTRDVLLPDIRKYVDKLQEESVDFDYFEFEEQNHIFPLYPIKEGITARKMIGNIILEYV